MSAGAESGAVGWGEFARAANERVRQIPLYRSLYGDGVDSLDLAGDFGGYPLLEKKHICEGFPKNWMSPALEGALSRDEIEFATTSGTTHDRMQVLRRRNWWRGEYHRTYRHNGRLRGFSLDENRKAIFTTAVCSNTVCHLTRPSYEERILKNTLYLNYHDDPNGWQKADVERVVSEMSAYGPDYLDADPVYLALFLKMRRRHGVSLPPRLPSFLTLSYELVPRRCRRFIERELGLPTFDLFGTTETGYLFVEQEDGSVRRCPEGSTVEFAPFEPEAGVYRLVVTSLKNEFMPLVRYRVGDLVKLRGAPTAGGRGGEVEYFCGREGDVVRDARGRGVSPGELDAALGRLDDDMLVYQLRISPERQGLLRYVTIDDEALSPRAAADAAAVVGDLYGLSRVELSHERAIRPEHSGKFALVKAAAPAQ